MKTIISSFAVLAFACCAGAQEPAVVASATLKDGSVFKGELLTTDIAGWTLFESDLTLPFAIVKTLSFRGTNGEAQVELVNDDRFTLKVSDSSFRLSSSIGELTIPCSRIKTLSLAVRKASATVRDDGLVFHCDFESEASVTSTAVGVPGVFKGGEFGPGKSGNGLKVAAYTSSARFELPEGSLGKAGTIEFWGRIDEIGGLTDGGCPRFFEIIDMASKAEISDDWNANNGSGGCGLSFRIDGLPVMASSDYGRYSYDSYLFPVQAWHHYALVWDADGIAGLERFPLTRSFKSNGTNSYSNERPAKASAAVFIDGRCVMAVPFDPSWRGPSLAHKPSTLFFPSREDEMPGYLKRGYSIDEFKLWNRAKTEFGL